MYMQGQKFFHCLNQYCCILVVFPPFDWCTGFVSCNCGGDVIAWQVWKGRSYLQVVIVFMI